MATTLAAIFTPSQNPNDIFTSSGTYWIYFVTSAGKWFDWTITNETSASTRKSRLGSAWVKHSRDDGGCYYTRKSMQVKREDGVSSCTIRVTLRTEVVRGSYTSSGSNSSSMDVPWYASYYPMSVSWSNDANYSGANFTLISNNHEYKYIKAGTFYNGKTSQETVSRSNYTYSIPNNSSGATVSKRELVFQVKKGATTASSCLNINATFEKKYYLRNKTSISTTTRNMDKRYYTCKNLPYEKLTFSVNGGSGSFSPSSDNYFYNTAKKLPNYTGSKSGYVSKGFYTTSSGTGGTAYSFNSNYTSTASTSFGTSKTLYVKWVNDPQDPDEPQIDIISWNDATGQVQYQIKQTYNKLTCPTNYRIEERRINLITGEETLLNFQNVATDLTSTSNTNVTSNVKTWTLSNTDPNYMVYIRVKAWYKAADPNHNNEIYTFSSDFARSPYFIPSGQISEKNYVKQVSGQWDIIHSSEISNISKYFDIEPYCFILGSAEGNAYQNVLIGLEDMEWNGIINQDISNLIYYDYLSNNKVPFPTSSGIGTYDALLEKISTKVIDKSSLNEEINLFLFSEDNFEENADEKTLTLFVYNDQSSSITIPLGKNLEIYESVDNEDKKPFGSYVFDINGLTFQQGKGLYSVEVSVVKGTNIDNRTVDDILITKILSEEGTYNYDNRYEQQDSSTTLLVDHFNFIYVVKDKSNNSFKSIIRPASIAYSFLFNNGYILPNVYVRDDSFEGNYPEVYFKAIDIDDSNVYFKF